jgi:hypothetical protein
VALADKLEDRSEAEARKVIAGAEHWSADQIAAFREGYRSTQGRPVDGAN